ncbi:MAG: ATP-binding protein [Calditrichaeota bacterium]|nr:ATP-binding protein [Calditrichota bacterium]
MAIEDCNHYEMTIPSDANRIKDVEKITARIAKHMNFSEDDKDSLAIAVTEIVGNAISHGNRNDLQKHVVITFDYCNGTIIVHIQDEGEGFDENEIDNPLDPENLLKESGRGIFIVRALIDEISISRDKKGTVVRLVKKASPKK